MASKFLKKRFTSRPSGVTADRSDAMSPALTDGVVFDKAWLSRGGKNVLSDLTLSLSERRIGLIGHNGSGKSTLARALNGLILPDRGTVFVCGLDTSTRKKQLPGLVGFIFQNPDHQIIFPTVEEEIAFGLEQIGSTKTEARAKARASLALHDCASWGERPVHDLSEGQKQLVCILAVLVMEPRILVLDEPFSSLDLPTRLKLIRWIEQLPQQVVMVSHDMGNLDGYDRVLWLKDGRVHQDDTPDRVIPSYRQAALSEALAR